VPEQSRKSFVAGLAAQYGDRLRRFLFTRPESQYASLQRNVDWFRFWLQDYEDADPSKSGQYVRWRKLREERRALVEKRDVSR
jgi:hypothetical protein